MLTVYAREEKHYVGHHMSKTREGLHVKRSHELTGWISRVPSYLPLGIDAEVHLRTTVDLRAFDVLNADEKLDNALSSKMEQSTIGNKVEHLCSVPHNAWSCTILST